MSKNNQCRIPFGQLSLQNKTDTALHMKIATQPDSGVE